MALYNERGLNTARLANIYTAACGDIPVENLGIMDDDEKEIFDWAVKEIAKANAEGRQIFFDIPFDPDDRYDGIYTKPVDQLAREIDEKTAAENG